MSNTREIMVVNRDVLFEKRYFEGFMEPNEFDYESVILNNYEWMEQGSAERNPAFKQPIGYAVLSNTSLNKIFLYQRSSDDKHYAEKRLQGKYACGLGGHIEKPDAETVNPISTSTLREVSEEVNVNESENLKTIGYINNEDEVGAVHFGILYVIETNLESVTPIDPEIASGQFVDIADFEIICNNPDYVVEEWARIALEPLKRYLNDTE